MEYYFCGFVITCQFKHLATILANTSCPEIGHINSNEGFKAKMNPNLSGNQWRPLQPQPNEFGGGNGGNLFHQQQQQQRPTRQITKNPQNMSMGFQNFAPNGFGGNTISSPFGTGAGSGNSNNGPLSPSLSNSASTGRLTSLMSPLSPNGVGGHGNMGNFDFMGGNNGSSSRQPDQTRLSPSFNIGSGMQQQSRGGTSNLMNMPNPLSPRDMERHSMNNGYDSVRPPSVGQSPNSGLSNGFRSASSSNFDRSMSVTTNGMGGNGTSQAGSFFDQFKSNTSSNTSNNQSEINSLLRHMSMPSGMSEQGSGGLGRTGGVNGGPGMMNPNGFLRSNSNMPNMNSYGSNNSAGGALNNSSNNRSELFTSIGGGPAFNSGQEHGGLTMRNSSPPLGNSSFNGSGAMNDMKIGMWDSGRPSSPGKVKTVICVAALYIKCR